MSAIRKNTLSTSGDPANRKASRPGEAVQETTDDATQNVADAVAVCAPGPAPLQPFTPEKIPDTIKTNQRWAPWRAVWNEKRQKFDKIPAHAKAPFYGISTARPERWYPYDVALKAYQDNPTMFAGVGYVMTTPHDVVGVDLDNCVKDNTIADWAQEVIDQLASYTELSPSGNGLRILISGDIPNDWTNHEVGIEVYGGHEPRFLTVTGRRLKASVLDVRGPGSSVLDALSAQYAKSKTTATVISMQLPDILDEIVLPSLDSLPLTAGTVKFLTTGDHGGDRSRALFAASVALYSAGLSDDEVFSLLALNPWAFEVALDHRRQDSDRALMYLWVEHCQKGKAKSNPVASLADFENLVLAAVVETVAPSAEFVELTGDADDFDDVSRDGEKSGSNMPPALIERAQAAINNVATEKPMRFAMQYASEFAEGPEPTWLVDGLIPQAELVVIYGESGSGKSFITLDIGGAIALGRPWRGLEVQQGKVAYVAAEGAGGFRKRIKAFAIGQGLTLKDLDDRLFVIDAAPNMLVKDDALDLCKSIIAGGPVSTVILDTWAQVMPGANENSGEDVGKALQHCKGIHKATGAVVVLVHHAGKDSSKGARGWSGLRAAADAEFEVTKVGKVHKLKNTKQKDGEDSLEWGFALPVVETRADATQGKPALSCYVAACEVPVPLKVGAGANKNTGKWAARVLEVLGELTQVQTTGIEKRAVLEMVVARSPDEGSDPTGRIRRQRASYALKQLTEDDEGDYVIEDDGTISLMA